MVMNNIHWLTMMTAINHRNGLVLISLRLLHRPGRGTSEHRRRQRNPRGAGTAWDIQFGSTGIDQLYMINSYAP